MLLSGQCYHKLGSYKKSLEIFFEILDNKKEELEQIGFAEDLNTNLLSQICFMLLTLKEYQKKDLMVEASVN